jgi:Phosphate-selective porin O and P
MTSSDFLAIVVAAALIPTVSAAIDGGGDVDQLRAEVAQLRGQIALLQASDGEQWLTEQRASEIRGLVQDVLADADTRASLQGSGMTAGWDKGFFLASADGNFKLKLSGYAQIRYIQNHQDDGPGDDSRGGFENTRTKVIVSGNVVNPNWLYKIEGNYSRSGGAFGLQDAWIAHKCSDEFTVKVGQYKLPFLKEELVSDTDLLTVERSLVNSEFTLGRAQAISVDWKNDWLHLTGAFSDGTQTTGGFNTAWSTRDTEYAFSARGEIKFVGDWSQYSDQSSWRGEEFAAFLGAAAHYQDGEYGTADDELELFDWTVDATVEFGGGNLMGYIVGRSAESTTVDIDQVAFVVQGGIFLTDDWELFGRFEWGDDDLGGEDLSVITVGVTKFFSKHQMKWTTDVGFGLEEVSSTWGSGFVGSGGDGAGWRTDSTGDDGQFVIRSQLQMTY